MAKKGKMSDETLTAIIQSRKTNALNYRDGELSSRRINNFQRYLGKPYGNERAGQSKVITRECFEAVEWALPSIMRVFMASPQIVEFVPVGAEDEAAAKQETAALNHIFLKQNDGFMTLYTWIKDTLMNPVGYCKVYWDVRKEKKTERYKGLFPQQVEELMADDNVEITGQEETYREVPTPAGPVQITLFDIELKRTSETGKVVVEPVPPEELTVDDKLGTVSLENADFVCHSPQISRSDLIEMGYDEDVVYSLPTWTEDYEERQQRHDAAEDRGMSNISSDASDASTELVEIDEAYLYVDYNGDGIAEYRRVVSCNEVVLENEEADMLPFVAMTAVPMPHLHVGLGWMELVLDIQKINTTLTQQVLNNAYRTNNPRTVAGPGVNMTDLMNDLPNAPIRAKNPDMLRIEPTQPVIGQMMPMFAHMQEMEEGRTGVSRATKGLDTDTLSRVTKGAFLGSLEQANQRLEALARIIAETGVKPLFLKIHQLVLTHQTDAFQAKISGAWQNIDPTEWRERNDMTVTVGLGTGNKQAQMMVLDKVKEMQGALLSNGKANLVTDQNLFETAAKMIEIGGLYNAEKYFSNPALQPPQQEAPPPPDPNMELVKVEQQKVQLTHQRDMMKMQSDHQKEVQKLQMEIAKLEQAKLKGTQDFVLKQRAQDTKDWEILLNSENQQSMIDQKNIAELNRRQNEYAQGLANA